MQILIAALALSALPTGGEEDESPLPLTLAVDEGRRRSDAGEFSFGPTAGFLKARDADDGTWFGGVQARFRFARIFAVEGSITFHRDEFLDGDLKVTTYPVQVTGLLLPFPDSPVEPYALAGAGWYYQRFDFDNGIVDEEDTDRSFGVHVGAGVLAEIGKQISIYGDFRWIFMDEPGVDNSQIEDEEFDTWQVTLGLSFRF